MTPPKQRNTETDEDFAQRLRKSKEARREQSRKYYEANKEAAKKRSRRYHEANREAENERKRRYYEANKEAAKERSRKYREANREAINAHVRNYRKARILKDAKGKPLSPNFRRALRPSMLTELILQEAENFCLRWGLAVEQKTDTDVLRRAARNIRENPFFPVVVQEEEVIAYYNEHGITNPWYNTDYLHESRILGRSWSSNLRSLVNSRLQRQA